MKLCCECGILKTYEEMVKDNRRHDGMGYLCLKCSSERKKLRIKLNPELLERRRRRNSKYRSQNRESLKEKALRYYYENIERVRQWKKDNAEKRRQWQRNRKAKKKANGGVVTLAQWDALKHKYHNTCLRCGKQEPSVKLTQDHVLPLALGGVHEIDNIQPLCAVCNSAKNKKHIDYRPYWKIS